MKISREWCTCMYSSIWCFWNVLFGCTYFLVLWHFQKNSPQPYRHYHFNFVRLYKSCMVSCLFQILLFFTGVYSWPNIFLSSHELKYQVSFSDCLYCPSSVCLSVLLFVWTKGIRDFRDPPEWPSPFNFYTLKSRDTKKL